MARRRVNPDDDDDAPQASSRSSSDEELGAIEKCVAVLDGLDDDQAANVIAYLARRYDADV